MLIDVRLKPPQAQNTVCIPLPPPPFYSGLFQDSNTTLSGFLLFWP